VTHKTFEKKNKRQKFIFKKNKNDTKKKKMKPRPLASRKNTKNQTKKSAPN